MAPPTDVTSSPGPLELEEKYLELKSKQNSDLMMCLLNPPNPAELLALRKRYGLPPFEDILAGRSVEPWTPSTFLAFLEVEHNAENLYFFEEVEAMRATKSGAKPPSDNVLTLPSAVRSDELAWATAISETFVKDTAPQQINIAFQQRANLLSSLSHAQSSRQVTPEIFNEAQDEVRKLMYQDAWPRFLVRMTSQNVGLEERKKRLVQGLGCFVLLVILVGLLLGLHAPRWALFASFPLWWAFFDGFVVYKTGVCSMAAANNQFRINKNDEPTTLLCPVAKKVFRNAGRRTLVRIVLMAVIMTGFTFALSYIIEAGTGMTMYG